MLLMRKIFAWLAPYDCLACGREGELLCAGCLGLVPPAGSRAAPAPCRDIWIGSDYEGVIRQLIHQYKFERARDAAAVLAVLLDRVCPPLPPNIVVTYVPTATSRIRRRGYDHAQELAKAFCRRRGLVVKSLLVRNGQARQVGASRGDRQRQAGIYAARSGTHLAGQNILLIDDIMTTGATLQAASSVLMMADATAVSGLVVAQKLRKQTTPLVAESPGPSGHL